MGLSCKEANDTGEARQIERGTAKEECQVEGGMVQEQESGAGLQGQQLLRSTV